MTEENKNLTSDQSNTVALVWMIFSIVWLILTITVLFSRLWIPLLILWFILWIIGLFSKPRWKARVAIIIPLIVFLILAACLCYLWKSFKTPAHEFINWAQERTQDINPETLDDDKFENIVNSEFNQLLGSLSEEDVNELYETSQGNNALEKRAYVFFNVLQQGMENALTTYSVESDNKIENPEALPIAEEENVVTEENQDAESSEEAPTVDENPTVENVEVFTESEQNDIEDIIWILE